MEIRFEDRKGVDPVVMESFVGVEGLQQFLPAKLECPQYSALKPFFSKLSFYTENMCVLGRVNLTGLNGIRELVWDDQIDLCLVFGEKVPDRVFSNSQSTRSASATPLLVDLKCEPTGSISCKISVEIQWILIGIHPIQRERTFRAKRQGRHSQNRMLLLAARTSS